MAYFSRHPDAETTIVLNNIWEGYQASLTGKVIKRWTDAFQRSPVVGNPNFPQFSWSRYGLTHRIVGSLFYTKSYSFMASSIGLFFEAGQGNRYSFAYAGDLNLDNIPNNDLIYVPQGRGDINIGTVENGVDNNNVPWFQFDTDLQNSYVDDFSVASKWQLQIGIRYIFN